MSDDDIVAEALEFALDAREAVLKVRMEEAR